MFEQNQETGGMGLAILFAALGFWAVLLASRYFWDYTRSGSGLKSLIILGVMGLFIGIWGLALWSRKKRRQP